MNFGGDRVDLVLWFDGACEPVNPGGVPAFGWVVRHKTGELYKRGKGVAEFSVPATNNLAEYAALGKALASLLELPGPVSKLRDLVGFGGTPNLLVRGDSKLVVNQIAGEWQCHAPMLVRCRDRVRELVAQLGWNVSFEWVPREQNAEADALSQEAWCEKTGKPFPVRPPKHSRRPGHDPGGGM